jgi:ABC-type Zn uptake system ZnuABC Zn-binding protein ZnuA
MVVWARNIAAAYAALDPAHAADYQARAEAYITELDRLDTWAASQLGVVPDGARNVATGHAVLGYLAHRYGLSIVGTIRPGASDLGEPSARDLADLEDRLQSQDVGAIFVGVYDNHTLADRVGADTGIPVVPLYLESLSRADGPAASYDEFMRFNVAAIVEALK